LILHTATTVEPISGSPAVRATAATPASLARIRSADALTDVAAANDQAARSRASDQRIASLDNANDQRRANDQPSMIASASDSIACDPSHRDGRSSEDADDQREESIFPAAFRPAPVLRRDGFSARRPARAPIMDGSVIKE
jgi:hypothetical protein